jgi:predicted AAA+ superfamily ATPase
MAKSQFLLTGSTHLFAVRDVADTLAGRIELLELWPFTQGEREQVIETFVDRAFADHEPPQVSPRSRTPRRAGDLAAGPPTVVDAYHCAVGALTDP